MEYPSLIIRLSKPLQEKYNNTVWAEDIKIERIALCKEGRVATFHGPNNEALIDEYYEEVASISLPQDPEV